MGALLLLMPASASATYAGANGKLVIEHQSTGCSPCQSPPAIVTSVTDVDPVTGSVQDSPEVPTPVTSPPGAPAGNRFPSYDAGDATLLYAAPDPNGGFGGWVFRSRTSGGGFSSPSPLPFGGLDAHLVLSPDGTRVAWDSAYAGNCYNSDVFVANIDGSGVRDLTAAQQPAACTRQTSANPGYEFRLPRWSADGSELVVQDITLPDGDGRSQLEVLRVSDGYRSFLSDPIQGALGGFDISPDGRYIAAANGCYNAPCTSNVLVIPTDGSPVFAVANSNSYSTPGQFGGAIGAGYGAGTFVAFSPDGSQIAALFRPQSGGPDQVVTIPFTGSGAPSPLWTAPAVNDSVTGIWWVALPPPTADITGGPPSATDSTSATFDFASTASNTTFECSLDHATYSACTSPVQLSALPDGSHDFAVRARYAGRPPGAAVSRTWTIDTVKPTITIDAAPSGTVSSHDATVSFHVSASGVAFTCSLDGAPATPCSSPYLATGLTDGAHTLSISGIDELGNASAEPAVARWSVAGSTAPPISTDCGARSTVKAQSGLLFLVGRAGTCLTRATVDGRPVWRASGPVTLNGVDFTPDPGGALLLSATASAGTFTVAGGGATIAFGDLFSVKVADGFSFGDGTAAAARWGDALTGLIGAAKIGSLRVLPSVLFDLSADNGGSVRIALRVALPAALASLTPCLHCVGVTGMGASMELAVLASNDKGIALGGKGKVADAYFGPFHLKDLELGYDDSTRTWEGGLGFVLGPPEIAPVGPPPKQIRVAVAVGPSPGFVCDPVYGCLKKVSIIAQDLNQEIPSTPIFLQKLGGTETYESGVVGGVRQDYPKYELSAGFSLGPEVSILGTTICAVCVEGSVGLSISDPMQFEASGKISLLDFPVSGGRIQYVFGGLLSFTGNVDLTIKGYGLSAAIGSGTFFSSDGSLFNVEASGDLALPGLFGGLSHAEAIFSNRGVAACATYAGVSVGWSLNRASRGFTVDGSCDLSRFRQAAPAARDAATRSGPATATIAAVAGVRAFAIHGASAAPDGTLVGPGGLRVRVSGGMGRRDATSLSWVDAGARTTYIILAHPKPGPYRFVPVTGQAITIAEATSRPDPGVAARVRSNRNGTRTVRFRQHANPGQSLELIEQGRGVARLLLRTSAASGRFTFRPAIGLGGGRALMAVVLQDGIPRRQIVLTRYRVSDAPPPRVTGLVIRRGQARWRPAPRAAGYVVALVTRAGTGRTVTVRRPSVSVDRTVISVTVVPLDATGRPGQPTTFRARQTRR